MARIEKIDNYTDLVAFVYDPDTLPTAIISIGDASISVHGLREAELGVLEKIFEHQGIQVDAKTGKLSKEAKCYRFWEQYPKLSSVCYAHHFSSKLDKQQLSDIEQWAVKTFDMCA